MSWVAEFEVVHGVFVRFLFAALYAPSPLPLPTNRRVVMSRLRHTRQCNSYMTAYPWLCIRCALEWLIRAADLRV